MELHDPAPGPLRDPPSSRGATEPAATGEVPRRLTWRAKLAVLAGSTVVALLAAEVAVRLQPGLYATGYVPASDPALVYELAPGYRIASLGAQISWQGLNDRKFPLAKPRGVFRIAVVGDSTSFGWKVAREKSFPKVLERQLNNLRPNGFEVINFSVPGYNTAQELEVIRRKVLAFHPDMVILVFTFNDVFLCNYFLPEITPLNVLAHRSYFVHLLLGTIDQWLGTPRRGSFAYPEPWLRFKRELLRMPFPEQRIYPQPGLEEVAYDHRDPPSATERVPARYRYMLGYENYRARLAEIRDLLTLRGVVFVSTGLFTADALRVNRELGIEHVATGMRPAELAAAFPRHTAESLVLPDDGHLSADGHSLTGRQLFLYLTRSGLVPGGQGP